MLFKAKFINDELKKGKKGSERPGHKYISREKKGDEWKYKYAENKGKHNKKDTYEAVRERAEIAGIEREIDNQKIRMQEIGRLYRQALAQNDHNKANTIYATLERNREVLSAMEEYRLSRVTSNDQKQYTVVDNANPSRSVKVMASDKNNAMDIGASRLGTTNIRTYEKKATHNTPPPDSLSNTKMEVYLTENLGSTSRFNIGKETRHGIDVYSWSVKTKKDMSSPMVPKYQAWADDGEPMGADPKDYDSRREALDAAYKYVDENYGKKAVKKSLPDRIRFYILSKAKKMAVGTTAEWGGKKYKKESEGVWKPIGGEHPGGAHKTPPPDAGQRQAGEKDIKTSSDLHKKFMDTMARMTDAGRAVFRGGKFDVENKQFVSANGKYALKYEHGEVGVVTLKKSMTDNHIEWFEKGLSCEKELIEWLKKHPHPADSELHAFAESKGAKPSEVEEVAYKLLGSFLGQGNSKGSKKNVNSKELKMGIGVEMEHTTDKNIAEKIARDHLTEISDYYTRLSKMEKEAGVKKSLIQRAKTKLVMWKGMTPHMTSLDTGRKDMRVHASHAEEHPDADIGTPYHSKGAGPIPKLKKKAVPSASTSESAEDEVKKSIADIKYVITAEGGKAVVASLEKSKKYPAGTIRDWKGTKYQKQGDGSWKEMKHQRSSTQIHNDKAETAGILSERKSSIMKQLNEGADNVQFHGNIRDADLDAVSALEREGKVNVSLTGKYGDVLTVTKKEGTHKTPPPSDQLHWLAGYKAGKEKYGTGRDPKLGPHKMKGKKKDTSRMTESEYGKLNFKSSSDYVDYLEQTLIPDLEEMGRTATAEDFQSIVDYIDTANEKEANRFIDYLEQTLIPDLESSGTYETAKDFKEGIHWMKQQLPKKAPSSKSLLPKMMAPINQKHYDKLNAIDPDGNFQTLSAELLSESVRGGVDLNRLAAHELAGRGQNKQGQWIGFDAAAKEHKIKGDEYPERNSDTENIYQELSTMPSAALAAAARGDVDFNKVAMRELRNRGADANGKWIGFDDAISKKK